MSLQLNHATGDNNEHPNFKRCLTVVDIILLGIGVTIGAGIFIVTGVTAATTAGPAVTLSFVLAGIASLLTAFSYAELASTIGGCGGAYSYAFIGFGQLVAWIIGWDLLFEYGVGGAYLAVGWSGYIDGFFNAIGVHLPHALIHGPAEGGIVNLPAIVIVLGLTLILLMGSKKGSKFNAFLVTLKLLTIGLFILIASFHAKLANWHSFMPYHWSGVMRGAALVFNAFIGFEVVVLASEETINPKRNIPIGLIGSFVICTLIYAIVSALLTSIVPYTTLNNASPVSTALLALHMPIASAIIGVGAIVGITTVLFAFLYAVSRVFFAMARDGLLPKNMATVSAKRQVPTKIIIVTSVLIAILAGVVPIDEAVKLINIGTLAAFVLVCAGVIILRIKQPNIPRKFKLSFHPWIPIGGILSCGYLMINLPMITWFRFIGWLGLGAIIYFCYSRHHATRTTEKIALQKEETITKNEECSF